MIFRNPFRNKLTHWTLTQDNKLVYGDDHLEEYLEHYSKQVQGKINGVGIGEISWKAYVKLRKEFKREIGRRKKAAKKAALRRMLSAESSEVKDPLEQ